MASIPVGSLGFIRRALSLTSPRKCPGVDSIEHLLNGREMRHRFQFKNPADRRHGSDEIKEFTILNVVADSNPIQNHRRVKRETF